ncbi:hypothetical protein PHOSAC3_121010 [Mesotoga infera]|nr:hypothetical protein PHOSAC3_121010 [Mesotoga infera]
MINYVLKIDLCRRNKKLDHSKRITRGDFKLLDSDSHSVPICSENIPYIKGISPSRKGYRNSRSLYHIPFGG